MHHPHTGCTRKVFWTSLCSACCKHVLVPRSCSHTHTSRDPRSRQDTSSAMASGSQLLKQLQQRRQPSLRASAMPPASAPSECEASHRTRIVVCGGVDCAGLGSGATLLEIEELCAEEAAAGNAIDVACGACTLQCANAPVVNVHKASEDNGGRGLVQSRHHSVVDSVERCAKVLEDATGRTTATSGGGPMLRRAHGLRWAALRHQARYPRQPVPSRQLTLALQAEKSAVLADPERLARAERRATRLTARSAVHSSTTPRR